MKRISGIWLNTEEVTNNHGQAAKVDFMKILMQDTESVKGRTLRVYFDEAMSGEPSMPDASLWMKQNDGKYKRLTGLWMRQTRNGKNYFFLELEEGNFRIFVNEFKKHDKQPDYILYQLTKLVRDAQGHGEYEVVNNDRDEYNGPGMELVTSELERSDWNGPGKGREAVMMY